MRVDIWVIKMDIKNSLTDNIEDAELILVGIGFEWQCDSSDSEKGFKILEAYSRLKKLLKGKNYYIMTLCYDDLIFEIFDEADHIVAPCGSTKRLQCYEHIVLPEDALTKEDGLYCPLCGEKLQPNNIENEAYIEEAYLAKFAEYKMWLQGTVNRKLLILELGADLKFPTIIRFPFDKLCMYNQKSLFYRVHESLCQHTAENSERAISIKKNSVDYIYFSS